MKKACWFVALLALLCATAFADDYIATWTSGYKATDEKLSGTSNWSLTLMRNEIYARHGRAFDNQYIRSYFKSKSWYHVNPKYSDRLLNSTEQYNIAFILKYQTKHFGSAATRPPGSGGSSGGQSSQLCPATATRYLHGGEVYGYTNWELPLIRNEIYARHGRTFENKYLRAYFKGKSWYHPDSHYTDSRMNKFEKVNAQFILDTQEYRFDNPATKP